ncbi:hypothetical protein KIN20_030356 [Parelaphostrongylus tenuis]|uniref:Uncharacterized protein n=1 Tax=Parelaphostrongylus tenuis TaxID=148309 RepID=A0AAD5WGT8_PARTN|nr:hypothetical protein KIN20_030356 [Parelaphostrongylus tenuis]
MGDRLMRSIEDSVMASGVIVADGDDVIRALGPLLSPVSQLCLFKWFTLKLQLLRFLVFQLPEEAAQAFISRLAVRTVFDVLERQGRSALLPDPIISAILDQFNVTITYEPRLCKTILNSPTDAMNDIPMMDNGCVVVGDTVTGICINIRMRPRNVWQQ